MPRHSAYCKECPHECVIQADVFEPDNFNGTTFCVFGYVNKKAHFKTINSLSRLYHKVVLWILDV